MRPRNYLMGVVLSALLLVSVLGVGALYAHPEKRVLRVCYGEPWKIPTEDAIKEFKAKFPDVEVKAEMIPYGVDIVAKESADFAAGVAADVVLVDSFMIPEYAEAGYLEPLDKLVEAWPDWKAYSLPMRKIVSYKGHVYGIMFDTDVRMIWYRKDVFKEAGLPVPWQPKTWDDIIKAALTIKKKVKGVFPIYVPAGTKWGEATTMQGFYMLLLGGDAPPKNRLYDYKTGKWIGKSPALLRAFKFYYDIYVKYKLAPTEFNFVPDVWGTWRRTFGPDRLIGMALGGSWEWGEAWGPKGIAPVPERDKVIGFAKMPGWSGGAHGEPEWVTVSGGWAWTIYSKSKVKDLAWEFLKIVNKRERVARYAAAFGKVAPRLDAAKVPEYAKNSYLMAILEYLKFTDYRDAMPGYSKVSYFIQETTEKIVLEGMKPEEALNYFYSKMVETFGKEKVEVIPIGG